MTLDLHRHTSMNITRTPAWSNGSRVGQRLRFSQIALTAALLLAVSYHEAAAQSLPAVHIIGTGGTIGSAGDYWHGRATRVPIDSIARVPGLEKIATVSTEQLWTVGSSSIGPARWLELCHHVKDLFQSRPDLSGIVITHGTDTMEETAYFLDLTTPGDRPIVVTGAMRPWDMPGTDGPANLLGAVRLVVDARSRGRGVLLTVDDRVFAARDVTKSNSMRVEAFQAPERGALGIVDAYGITFHRPSPARRSPQFDVSGLATLPKVDIVYSYAGADSVPIDAIVAAGAKGLVIAGVGRGNMTPEQTRAVERARAKGVVVVVATRAGSGPVPTAGLQGPIGAGDLNAQKARVLLMLALTRTADPAQVARIFDSNQ
jgi:L-asparaginase